MKQIWHNGEDISRDEYTTKNILICFDRLAKLVEDDLRAPLPHLCVSFAATSRVLIVVSRAATYLQDDGITRESLRLCSLLIESDEEDFLSDPGFANSFMTLTGSLAGPGAAPVGSDTRDVMVEILFGIASRIRLQPQILSIWFRPNSHDERHHRHKEASPIRRTKETEFLLFYILLDYVHVNGRAGEFARMGLLYIIETSVHSEDLERWIVESDLASLMASGLQALYSQLSRKLVMSYPEGGTPAIVLQSRSDSVQPSGDAEETTSPEFRIHLDTFISDLVFLQDILEHCISVEIQKTLLEHFRLIFLQQMLYPSLLQSSDIDGGSSVAVLTYLRCILESIEHPDLVQSILQYLLNITKKPHERASSTRPAALIRRRKSEKLTATLAQGEEQPSPALFTLVDLILTSLGSQSQQTVSATLRLLSTLFRKQHQYTVLTLLRKSRANFNPTTLTLEELNESVDYLLTMAEIIGPAEGLDESYDSYTYDSREVLELHPCSLKRLTTLPTATSLINTNESITSDFVRPSIEEHVIDLSDPLLSILTSLLERFFSNDVETNLCLTQSILDIASCSKTSLKGWLLVQGYSISPAEPRTNINVDEDASKGPLPTSPKASSPSEMHPASGGGQARLEAEAQPAIIRQSPIFATLDRLAYQVSSYRQGIDGFDLHINERKTALKIQSDIDDASASLPIITQNSVESLERRPSQTKNRPLFGSINERLLSEVGSEAASRSSSPRGRQRQQGVLPAPSLVGRLNHLHITPSRSASQSTSRTYSPSPLRGEMTTTAPGLVGLASSRRSLPIQASSLPKVLRSHRTSSQGSSPRSESSTSSMPVAEPKQDEEVTLDHFLTNVIILQEFLVELAALIDVRATMFGVVGFG